MRTRTSPSRAPERLAALVVLLGCASASLAWAGPEQQAEGSAEPRIDAWGPIESLDDRVLLTSEPSRARLAERPVGPWRVRCARERPVCVHARDSVGEAALERALSAANDGLRALSALGLPRPLEDGSRGGSPALDVYLDERVERAEAYGDPGLWGTSWDRAPAFVVAPSPPPGDCSGELEITRGLVEASLLGLDAATDPSVLEAVSTHLGLLLSPCSTAEFARVDEAQRAPERALLESPAAFLYLRHLEERWGSGRPGELAFSMVAISAQRSPASRALVDEPDVYDALRVTLRQNESSLPATVLDYAVARAFLGSRSDDAHLVDVARYGDLGRPRHEWAVPYDSLPRRLMPARPVDALGATYVWVDLASAPLDSELTVVAEWEEPVSFRWALVLVDGGGAELSRTEVAPVFGETRMEKTLRKLGGAGGVLIVGLNEGEARRDAPLDPSRSGPGPRMYQFTLYR